MAQVTSTPPAQVRTNGASVTSSSPVSSMASACTSVADRQHPAALPAVAEHRAERGDDHRGQQLHHRDGRRRADAALVVGPDQQGDPGGPLRDGEDQEGQQRASERPVPEGVDRRRQPVGHGDRATCVGTSASWTGCRSGCGPRGTGQTPGCSVSRASASSSVPRRPPAGQDHAVELVELEQPDTHGRRRDDGGAVVTAPPTTAPALPIIIVRSRVSPSAGTRAGRGGADGVGRRAAGRCRPWRC